MDNLLNTKEVKQRLEYLTTRALLLDKEFDKLTLRLVELEQSTDLCAIDIDKNKKTVSVMELLMKKDSRAHSLLSHISLFFIVVLKKVKQVVHNVRSVKDMWTRLHDDVAVLSAFTAVTEQFGFSKSDQDSLKVIFDIVYDRNLAENETNYLSRRYDDDFAPITASPAGDTEIASLILYLNLQDDIDTTLKYVLRQAIAVAYCSVVGTDSLEDIRDVTSPVWKRWDWNVMGTDVRQTHSETTASVSERVENKQPHSKSMEKVTSDTWATELETITKCTEVEGNGVTEHEWIPGCEDVSKDLKDVYELSEKQMSKDAELDVNGNPKQMETTDHTQSTLLSLEEKQINLSSFHIESEAYEDKPESPTY